MSSPPTTSDSLFARARIFPDCSVAREGESPTAPTMAFSTMSASDSRASVSMASGPDRMSTSRSEPSLSFSSTAASSSAMATRGGMNSRTCPTSSSWLLPAPKPTTRNRSGLCRTTSRAWVPIEPVEPRIASDRMSLEVTLPCHLAAASPLEDQPKVVESRRGRQKDGIDAIQDPAVAGEDRAHVLHPEVALDQGLDEVAERREYDDDDGQADGPDDGEVVDGRRDQGDRQGKRDRRRPEQALP